MVLNARDELQRRRPFRLALAGGAVVAGLSSNVQLSHTARRSNFQLNSAPCAVLGPVRRKVADEVLILLLASLY
jgi:hypothetical protein